MKKEITILKIFFTKIFILVAIFIGLTHSSLAVETAGNSASINRFHNSSDINNQAKLIKLYRTKKTIKNVLESYHSPLIDEVDTFVDVCFLYDLDCYLLPAIAGLESYFGHYIYPNSYNPFGWGGGYIIFSNWKESIETVAYGLRKNYIDKGAKDIYAIGRIYSESPTWAPRIINLINRFTAEEEKISLYFAQNQVQL